MIIFFLIIKIYIVVKRLKGNQVVGEIIVIPSLRLHASLGEFIAIAGIV